MGKLRTLMNQAGHQDFEKGCQNTWMLQVDNMSCLRVTSSGLQASGAGHLFGAMPIAMLGHIRNMGLHML